MGGEGTGHVQMRELGVLPLTSSAQLKTQLVGLVGFQQAGTAQPTLAEER